MGFQMATQIGKGAVLTCDINDPNSTNMMWLDPNMRLDKRKKLLPSAKAIDGYRRLLFHDKKEVFIIQDFQRVKLNWIVADHRENFIRMIRFRLTRRKIESLPEELEAFITR
jgi:transposase